MPGDRVNLPSDKPFRRTPGSGGYHQCPDCHKRFTAGGKAKAEPDPTGDVYLRALISRETKRWLIDESRRQGLSISALVRSIIRHYHAAQAQGQ